MSFLDGLRHRLSVLLRGDAYAREVKRELEFHRELDRLSHPRDAEPGAAGSLGNVTYYREEVRRMTLQNVLDRVRQDLSYAWRGLKREPGFAAMVVGTIALGIGANAAIFSLLNRVFVQSPTGVAAPGEVRRLYTDAMFGSGREAYDRYTYPHIKAIAAADTTQVLAPYTDPDSVNLIRGDERIPIRQSYAGNGYFSLLGVRPQLGRFFLDDENRIEVPTPVAVLSDDAWRRLFAADPSAIGQKISIDFHTFTVIGVAPRGFTGIDLGVADVWIPLNTYPARDARRPWYETFRGSFRLIARLRTPDAELRLVNAGGVAYRAVRIEGFGFDTTATLKTGPIIRAVGPARLAQEVAIATRLAGVSVIVLLIVAANVANLMIVRAARRRRELAVRRALGASTGRLFAQTLTETSLLAAIGCVAAVLVAFWGGTALRRLLLPEVRWADAAVDWRTILFSVAVASIVGLIAALAPAIRMRRTDLAEPLKSGGRGGGVDRSRLRAGLLIIQAALSLVLVVGAALFVRSLDNIRGIDLGFAAKSVTYAYPLFAVSSPTSIEIGSGLTEIAERLKAAPGVEAVATASSPPMRGYSGTSLFLPDRDSIPVARRREYPAFSRVSPGFFHTTGIRLIAGRDFDARDGAVANSAVIVSAMMARSFWPDRPAIGQCLIMGRRTNPCSIVVGVVTDAHRMTVIENPMMQFYVPLDQSADGAAAYVLFRTARGAEASVSKFMSAELKRRFPTMTTPRVRSIAQSLEAEFRPWKLGATRFSVFGALALVVAAVGVFSVVSYAVSQRTHEMGIRIALGAKTRDILDLVIGGSVRTVAIGIVVGAAVAMLMGRLVESLLFGVTTTDPSAFVAASAILSAVAIVASSIPAWRAARIDPATSLRAE
jgi:predicted permease